MQDRRGVWHVAGPRAWVGQYYVYEVKVYSPVTGRLEVSLATDPYSRALSANGGRTQVADLNDSLLSPPGWEGLGGRKPPLEHLADAALYELHVRDFSAGDPTASPETRGTFLAFADEASQGSRHLASLAQAGITHVHLLPLYDFGSVDEDRSRWEAPDEEALRAAGPDSEAQQAAVAAVQKRVCRPSVCLSLPVCLSVSLARAHGCALR